MIRNEREYREALRARDEQLVGLQEAKERLEKKGLNSADVEYALNPLRSFLLEIEDEINAYERLKDSAAHGETIKLSSLKSLGRALVEVRIARGCTQRELAEQLGVHETQVSRDEKNDYKGVTVERACRLLDALRFQFEGRLVPAETAIKQSLEVSSEDQVQIQTSNFATAFCSVLRQDPNIVFLDEPYDYVSAKAFVGNAFVTAPYWHAAQGLHYVAIETSLRPEQSSLFEKKGLGCFAKTAWKEWGSVVENAVPEKAQKRPTSNVLAA